ncbi:hypothetical protein GOZ78_22195 [Agrobacterium vitis]|uniref:Uncharacterized protein n=1 Tax=Agrobacterium vitis TaxID=373 RepID=A0ABD6GJ65_AGRVI|nr:hypothetical protein [Agrobacterium vitis]MUO81760.1 hypothetical protein [Agrobacterium vitis]MUO96687.1 hypothetical protein [Agrobacterium vitis]MUP07376.1 hypothetical protein [Agrobacterium vitis]MVA12714.1 hypothetical protein [Agrobacterium vitis]MVA94805.1 hypothetical protein [Agrobacterium vitis]
MLDYKVPGSALFVMDDIRRRKINIVLQFASSGPDHSDPDEAGKRASVEIKGLECCMSVSFSNVHEQSRRSSCPLTDHARTKSSRPHGIGGRRTLNGSRQVSGGLFLTAIHASTTFEAGFRLMPGAAETSLDQTMFRNEL